MDALAPVGYYDGTKQEIGSEAYFAAAEARRERPPLEVLSEWRRQNREDWTYDLQQPVRILSDLAHSLGQCSRVYFNWNSQ